MEAIVFYIALGIGVLYLILKFVIKKVPKKVLDEVYSWFETFFVVSIIMYFLLQAFKIPSGSMEDTLLIGDHLFAVKFIYGWKIPFTKKTYLKFSTPKRGDIVIFKFPINPKKDFVKRCIGLPGETVEIKNKKVYINGKPLKEPYVVFKEGNILPRELSPRDNWGPVKIPENNFFVMGDNRDRSQDSRFWGFLERHYLRGKAFFIYWPPKRIRLIKHERPVFEDAP
ncbi:MAG: signal peptidase I [Elusimicrobia bacterium]|nr:signal peptidase I [Elusimicrobiota bacterium]